MATDPRNFLLNTDYEMDKIIYYKTGSLSIGDYDVSFSHGLGFTPLLFGVCAFNSDFSDPRPIPYEELPGKNLSVSADGTKVYLSYVNQDGTPNKIYYRLYGLEPTNSTADVAYTSGNAENFILNTDYNYCKLQSKGIINNPSSATITHNLGYIPQALFWRVYQGKISPITYLDPVNSSTSSSNIRMRANSVDINYPSTATLPAEKIHYRIYYDEA